jgi:hypothetical protein
MFTFLVFFLGLVTMIVILVINKYKPEMLLKAVDRVKYRLINDFFSIFTFPLLLFGFALLHVHAFDAILGVVVILLTLSWIIYLCNLIISAK